MPRKSKTSKNPNESTKKRRRCPRDDHIKLSDILKHKNVNNLSESQKEILNFINCLTIIQTKGDKAILKNTWNYLHNNDELNNDLFEWS
jgi:hypothetical protein